MDSISYDRFNFKIIGIGSFVCQCHCKTDIKDYEFYLPINGEVPSEDKLHSEFKCIWVPIPSKELYQYLKSKKQNFADKNVFKYMLEDIKHHIDKWKIEAEILQNEWCNNGSTDYKCKNHYLILDALKAYYPQKLEYILEGNKQMFYVAV